MQTVQQQLPPKLYAPLPFTIIIDTAEQQPFSFAGMKSDANYQYRDYLIEPRSEANPDGKIIWQSLGRHPNSYGDYSIEGFNRHAGDDNTIHVERKSIDDVIGTVCGWGERRKRFDQELVNLWDVAQGGYSAIIVEGSFQSCVAAVRETPNKTLAENRNAFHRSIISLQQDHEVPWFFCDSRRFAEVTAFRFLERAWRKLTK